MAIYSNGTPAQALLVRKTLAKVFPHTTSIMRGYLLLGSHSPMHLNAERVSEFEKEAWPLAQELADINERTNGFASLIDPQLRWSDKSAYTITDDHPLVEYPKAIEKLLKL